MNGVFKGGLHGALTKYATLADAVVYELLVDFESGPSSVLVSTPRTYSVFTIDDATPAHTCTVVLNYAIPLMCEHYDVVCAPGEVLQPKRPEPVHLRKLCSNYFGSDSRLSAAVHSGDVHKP